MLSDKKNKNKESSSGIVLLAKQSGMTSFASLSIIKKSLGTKKVGHTGTLDSFADGLLVVLSERLTKLVSHITDFDKSYIALIEFGSETDTLDPTGEIIKTGNIPCRDQIVNALKKFTGVISQKPPAYSAIHIGGKRASDIMRSGKEVDVPAREITIYSNELVDFKGRYAIIKVRCSKGTYIRALARDIAYECGSCAHLKALRRLSVGPFVLEQATGASYLPEFTIDNLTGSCTKNKKIEINEVLLKSDIKSNLMPMTFELAKMCGFDPVILASSFVNDYSNGRPLRNDSFALDNSHFSNKQQLAVFYPNSSFAGIVYRDGKKFNYGFVVPPVQDFTVYSWEQIVNGQFNEKYKADGTALTIGSFDGPHIGHDMLFDSVLTQSNCGKKLVPGVVTFSKSLRGIKHAGNYRGDVATLAQRLEGIARIGFAFAVVIDFSGEFGKMTGTDFIDVLLSNCGMKYLAEGVDFHCGYKGATDMKLIKEYSVEKGFVAQTIDSVLYADKKVSSSRIRDDIYERNFSAVEVMLNRPFELDCTGFQWQMTEIDGKQFIVTRKSGIQIFPPDGEYEVIVKMSAGSEGAPATQTSVCVHTFQSCCKLEAGQLRLPVPGLLMNGYVRALQFR